MMTASEDKKRKIEFFLKQNVLVSPEFLDDLDEESITQISKNISSEVAVLDRDSTKIIEKRPNQDINWAELEKYKALYEKKKDTKVYSKFKAYLLEEQVEKEKEFKQGTTKVIFSYNKESKKRSVSDFVAYFNARYRKIKQILQQQNKLKNIASINRISRKKESENVSIIGAVLEKQITKNNNIIIKLEDPTGIINVIITKTKPDLMHSVGDLVKDEIIGVVGVSANDAVFANEVIWPDVPNQDIKKSEEEAYAVFISDLHVGSNKFLADDFNRFLKWINCKAGNEQQREIATKVRYLFIIGDTVDGIGIYPDQESELEIKDINEQYSIFAGLLKQIPNYIQIIVCPGNHDAVRISEPQSEMRSSYASALKDIDNLILVSNPAYINIHSSDTFPGFDVLMYHGNSFDYHIANVEGIRSKGGYDRADLVMKFVLKRRHLAPTYASTLAIPDETEDRLVIDKVPDFFVTGHLHKTAVSQYRHIILICGSCWQSKTTFQEKMGHNPEPSRVPVVNLKTREIKVMKFGK